MIEVDQFDGGHLLLEGVDQFAHSVVVALDVDGDLELGIATLGAP